MNAGSSRSTGCFEEHNHEHHRNKTDWAYLTCPLIGTDLRVVPDHHAPRYCFSQWEALHWIGSGQFGIPGEIKDSLGFWRLPLSGY